MVKLLLAAAAFAVLRFPAYAQDTFERTLPVSAQPDLYVSNGSGHIHIFAGQGDQIRIVGHVHASNTWTGDGGGNLEERIRRIVANPPVAQSGNSVHVGDAPDRSLYNNIAVDYEVAAPTRVALNLRTGSGDVQVDGIGRFLAAYSGSGAVRVHQLRGPAELHSGSGDVELEETGSGDIKAETGSGSIRIHGLNGGVNARTGSGDVECDGHIAGMSKLTSGSGSIRLHPTTDSHFQLDASTGSGSIRVHMPGGADTDSDRHHVSMSVNGGGPPLAISTGSGDVEVTPR